MKPADLSALAVQLEASYYGEPARNAADYLRAQADAQPTPAVPAGWKWVPVEPTREMLVAARDWSIQKNGIAVGNDQATGCFQAMLAAAPAVPQAEPIDPHMIVADDRFPDEQAEPKRELTADERDVLDSALRSSVRVVARGVAEPKREALSDDEILDILDIATAADLRFSMYSDDVETRAAIKRLARAVERAAYERAVMECLETAAELRRCADGCTDSRYDWKADGDLDCADAIRALGRQHD